jgi:hypothetical protein
MKDEKWQNLANSKLYKYEKMMETDVSCGM